MLLKSQEWHELPQKRQSVLIHLSVTLWLQLSPYLLTTREVWQEKRLHRYDTNTILMTLLILIWLSWGSKCKFSSLCFFLEFLCNKCRKIQILHLKKNIFHKYWLFCSGYILYTFDLVTFCLLSVIHKQRLKEYIYYMGFSLSFKVDSYDVNIGGWETKCCRQLLHFTFSLYPIAPKSRRLKRSSSRFFSWLLALNENPDYFNKSEPLTRFWTDYICHRCPFAVIWCRCVPGSTDGWLYLRAILRLHPC